MQLSREQRKERWPDLPEWKTAPTTILSMDLAALSTPHGARVWMEAVVMASEIYNTAYVQIQPGLITLHKNVDELDREQAQAAEVNKNQLLTVDEAMASAKEN